MTIAEFIAKYTDASTGLFKAGQSRGIGSDDMRAFTEDITTLTDIPVAGNLINSSVVTSGSTITLNFAGTADRIFYGDASFATAKTLALSNATNAVRLTFLFEITNIAGTLELPANFMCVDARMVGQVFTPFDTGRYKMRADFDGTNWWVDEFIGLYQT